MLSYFEISPLTPPPVGWGGGGLKKYRFSRQFMKCLTFDIFTHKTPNPRWGGVGLIFVYYFSLQFMTFPGLLIFWPPKIPTATPFGGGGNCFIDFLDSSWHFPVFWFFDPLKFPLRPLLVGGGGDFFYRFSRQFMKFTGLFKCWPPTPPPRNPPGWDV